MTERAQCRFDEYSHNNTFLVKGRAVETGLKLGGGGQILFWL